MFNDDPLFAVSCIGCGKLDYYCSCMTCWTPRKIESLRTNYLQQLVRDDFQGALSVGDAKVLVVIKQELGRRGVDVRPAFAYYKQ
jgi:hypothetical protein